MKKKKIYPIEWVQLHPYTTTDSTDRYYTDIANQIYDLFQEFDKELFSDEKVVRHTSLCLTAWFEDIISQTGIWTTFTAECKRLYGHWLPFYPMNDYDPDYFNVEDLRFLLWHHIQEDSIDEGRIINPENPGIELLAYKIYQLFDSIYETAPENERLWQCLHPKGNMAEDFEVYRKVLYWFHYTSYFNVGNIRQLEEETEYLHEEMEDIYEEISESQIDILLYNVHTSLTISGRRDLLSVTSNEWLALWARRNDGPKAWTSTDESRRNSLFLLVDEDQDYFYLKNLCADDEVCKAAKSSFRLNDIREKGIGKAVFTCSLLRFGEVWYQFGALIADSLDEKMEKRAKEIREENERLNEKKVFKNFMEITGGKPFVFCKSKKELEDFLSNKMEYQLTSNEPLPPINEQHGIVLIATPQQGLHIQVHLCECLKSPENTFYDPEAADEKSLYFIISSKIAPYYVSCLMQDHGMLADARLNSLNGKEYGRDLLQQNARFLTDYFHHRNREKDFREEDLKAW